MAYTSKTWQGLCPRCRRAQADLMKSPLPRSVRCSGTDSLECHEWTSSHWAGQVRLWREAFERAASANVGFVRQNCLLISRNTRMEQMLQELGVSPPLKGVFDPPDEG